MNQVGEVFEDGGFKKTQSAVDGAIEPKQAGKVEIS